MRRTMTVLLIVLLLVPELPARSNNDWEKVKKLKPGTAVQILLWSGDNLRGRIDSVGDAGLHLTMADGSSSQTSRLSELDRISIRRIARIPPTPPAGSQALDAHRGRGRRRNWVDGRNGCGPEPRRPLPLARRVGGAGMGFLASCMALAVVGSVEVGRGLRRRKVVYEDEVHHPPNGKRGIRH